MPLPSSQPHVFSGPTAVPLRNATSTARLPVRSASFRRVLRQLARYASFVHATVLLEGESGTGETICARYLHDCSPRATATFEQVVLSTLDDNLAASELFGHVTGAYTDARRSRPGRFVSAHGGTLFLDEIGKASESVQRKLLHVVEHGEIWPVGADRAVRADVRLVAATNIPLERLVDEHAFLPDLLQRVVAFRVRLPPLRERAEDIPLLVESLIAARAARCGYDGQVPGVDPRLMSVLQDADWPGNVRQLDAILQRVLIDAEGDTVLTPEHLSDEVLEMLSRRTADAGLTTEGVRRAVQQSKGSVTEAARLLGVTRTTVYKYLRADL